MGGKSTLLWQFLPKAAGESVEKAYFCIANMCAFSLTNKTDKLMRKTLLTLVTLVLALTSARASVVLNETNFPAWVLRAALVDCGIDADGDGIRNA